MIGRGAGCRRGSNTRVQQATRSDLSAWRATGGTSGLASSALNGEAALGWTPHGRCVTGASMGASRGRGVEGPVGCG